MVSLLAVSLILLCEAPVTLGAAAPETDLEIVVAAVHARLPLRSPPMGLARFGDEPAEPRGLDLLCETARYRVIFEGDTGPQVMRIE